MNVSVVIPTYRRSDALPRTLDALESQTCGKDAFEVIVVDDPVEDDSRSVIEQVAARNRSIEVRILHREARGVSAARNIGWRGARASIVMFLGDDILASPTLLQEHIDWHATRGGADVGVLGHVDWASELTATPFMRWLERGVQFDYTAIRGDEADWFNFYTANISLPRALLEEVNGFDEERFPFLYEDLDLGYRLNRRGFRLLYNRHALGEHLHPTSIDDWRRRMAATATAERRWVEHRVEMPAYFHDKFAEVMRMPPAHGRATKLLHFVRPNTPLVGRVTWRYADIYFRQQLAPAFLDQWERDGAGHDQVDGEPNRTPRR
jgi:glycosyltransferase involved in cell wall biosynthesis